MRRKRTELGLLMVCLLKTLVDPSLLILDVMRFLSAHLLHADRDVIDYTDIDRLRAQGPEGLMKLNKYMAMLGRTGWILVGYYTPDQQGIYDLLKDWTKEQFEERDKAELANFSQDEIDMLRFLTDSMESPAGVQGWNVRIHGDFWVVGMDDEGTYLVPAENIKRVYQVLGVRNAIYPMVIRDFPRPVLMTLTMIPFYGRLVYDGVIAPAVRVGTPVGMPPMASVAMAEQLHQTVQAAKEKGLSHQPFPTTRSTRWIQRRTSIPGYEEAIQEKCYRTVSSDGRREKIGSSFPKTHRISRW